MVSVGSSLIFWGPHSKLGVPVCGLQNHGCGRWSEASVLGRFGSETWGGAVRPSDHDTPTSDRSVHDLRQFAVNLLDLLGQP